MKVIVDLCAIPMGVGVFVGAYIAQCQHALKEAELEHHLHTWGTNILLSRRWVGWCFYSNQEVPWNFARRGRSQSLHTDKSGDTHRSWTINAGKDR